MVSMRIKNIVGLLAIILGVLWVTLNSMLCGILMVFSFCGWLLLDVLQNTNWRED